MKRLLAVALLLVSYACDRTARTSSSERGKVAAAPEQPTKPLDGHWTDGGVNYEFPGGSFGAIVTEDGLQVVFDRAPKGTRYHVGDISGVISSGYASISVPFPVDVGKVPVAGAVTLGAHVDPRMTIRLVLPDGSGGDVPLKPVDVSSLVKSTLEQGLGKPLAFPNEAAPEGAEAKDSLVYMSSSPRIFGKNGDVADVDFLAAGVPLPETTGTVACDFTNEDTGKQITMTMNLHPWKVTLYERRTGKVVESKTFPPSQECPMFSMTSAGQKTIDNPGNDEAAAAWLAERTGLDEIPAEQLMHL
jgi:hypothetical protein